MSAFVPVASTVVQSSDLGEVQELFSRRYAEHRPRVLGDARDFRFWSRSATAGDLIVDRVHYRAHMAITTDPLPAILVVSVLGGRFGVTAGRQSARSGAGGSLLLPAGVGIELTMDRTTQHAAQLPAEVITGVAARLGVDPVDFRFDAMEPISAAANRHWAATITYLTRLLATPGDGGLHPLLLTAALETAATAAVTVFPNSTMTLDYVADPGQVAPAAIRRAVAYVDANAASPITLHHIAEAAGVGVRALQTGFRRHLDTTPVGYLRRVRLERAHRDLQAADPANGDTVADIAYRWGFANLGRFAARYHSEFGRRPSQTLHT